MKKKIPVEIFCQVLEEAIDRTMNAKGSESENQSLTTSRVEQHSSADNGRGSMSELPIADNLLLTLDVSVDGGVSRTLEYHASQVP